jgi:peptidoglycan L-alanyl-D-glutamate endopeptidase CwlK
MPQLPLDPQVVNRDLDLLCPKFRRLVEGALAEANTLPGVRCDIFEGYRNPQRQAWLYSQGRDGKPGKIVTNAKEWESWHNFSLAVDIVFKDERGNWTWKGNYNKVEEVFMAHGLERGPRFEHAHFQKTGGLNIWLAKGLAQQVGLPRVWMEVFPESYS